MLQATAGEMWSRVEQYARTIPGWVAFRPGGTIQREFAPLAPSEFAPREDPTLEPVEPLTVIPVKAKAPKPSLAKEAFGFFGLTAGISLAIFLFIRESDKATGRR